MNLIEQIKVNDTSIDGYQGTYYDDNPEYIKVTTDTEGKVLEGIKSDGTKHIAGDLEVDGNILNSGIQEQIDTAIEEGIGGLDRDAMSSISVSDNPEYIEAKTDAEGKLLAGRTPDGAAFENVGFTTPIVNAPKVSIDGHTIENIEDPEGRTEILIDNESKILSYRDNSGTKVEKVGVVTNNLEIKEELQVAEQAKKSFDDLVHSASKTDIREWDLPKFGYTDIVSEIFYLTAAGWSSYTNDVELRLDYEDTDENAQNKVTICNFYIKRTNTKLDFYAATKVTNVDNKYYVTSSLVDGAVVPESIEVRQCEDVPPVLAWPVDKNTKHNCIVNIDFGKYLSETFYAQVSFQGSSTLLNRKKNFRYTFFKNNKYEKKNKIKIGEFVRTSSYNLKANWGDVTRMKECILNKIFMSVWEHRDQYDQYPWNKDYTPYTAATGMIKGFPIEVSVGGEFYGLDVFGLKKDGKNYLLDKEEDGMIQCGTRGHYTDRTNWIDAQPIDWEDELNDEEDWVIDNHTLSDYDALTTFFDFINGRLVENGEIVPFDKSTMPERMSIIDWIDYAILFQVFTMVDNSCRNMILYTGADKKKFYPFFYDLDQGWQIIGHPHDLNCFIPAAADGSGGGNNAGDMSFWDNFNNAYWDEICNRYKQLRQKELSIEYIASVCKEVLKSIPDSSYIKENEKWNQQCNKEYFDLMILHEYQRLKWLDENYYI